MTEGKAEDWSQAHDLALIYIACMHGGDLQIDDVEKESVLKLMAARFPDASETEIQDIVDQSLLVYLGQGGGGMLSSAIYSLKEQLSEGELAGVLRDLTSIASADGMVFPGEAEFISQVARAWGLPKLSSGN